MTIPAEVNADTNDEIGSLHSNKKKTSNLWKWTFGNKDHLAAMLLFIQDTAFSHSTFRWLRSWEIRTCKYQKLKNLSLKYKTILCPSLFEVFPGFMVLEKSKLQIPKPRITKLACSDSLFFLFMTLRPFFVQLELFSPTKWCNAETHCQSD